MRNPPNPTTTAQVLSSFIPFFLAHKSNRIKSKKNSQLKADKKKQSSKQHSNGGKERRREDPHCVCDSVNETPSELLGIFPSSALKFSLSLSQNIIQKNVPLITSMMNEEDSSVWYENAKLRNSEIPGSYLEWRYS